MTQSNIDKPHKLTSEGKIPGTKEDILYDSTYVKDKTQQH